MGFAPTKRWKSRSITRWDAFLNQNQPTDSAEEAKIQNRSDIRIPGWHDAGGGDTARCSGNPCQAIFSRIASLTCGRSVGIDSSTDLWLLLFPAFGPSAKAASHSSFLVKHLSHLPCQFFLAERLVQERNARIEHTSISNHVRRVARYE